MERALLSSMVVFGRPTSTILATLTVCVASCAGGVSPRLPAQAPAPSQLAELWVDPGAARRDLFWGVGGKQHAPDPSAVYTLDSQDDLGFSTSYDVVDPNRVEWSAKIGPEAQTEVVVSRVLWGIGYHQPPIYYLPSWTVD